MFIKTVCSTYRYLVYEKSSETWWHPVNEFYWQLSNFTHYCTLHHTESLTISNRSGHTIKQRNKEMGQMTIQGIRESSNSQNICMFMLYVQIYKLKNHLKIENRNEKTKKAFSTRSISQNLEVKQDNYIRVTSNHLAFLASFDALQLPPIS